MPAMPRVLWLFCFVNLVVGSAAFVIGGILAPLSSALDISLAAAGQAMTAYALSTAVLAPLLLLLTGRWPRKVALLAALAVFTLGNVVCAMAPSLPVLLAGRVLMGMGAAITPLAAGIAVAMVAPAQRGRALSLVFLGMSLSYLVGVPLGAWLGLAYGWHAPIWLFAGASALTMVLLGWGLPSNIRAPGATFAGLGTLLVRRDVQAVLALTLSYFVAIFAVFSYIGPALQALVPMSRNQQALTLALFGAAGVVGTLSGGKFSDRFGPRRTLFVQLAVLGLTMLVLPLTAGSWPAMVLTLLVWGCAGFGMMVPQQSRLAALSPAQAPILLSLNTSMLYFGTALGAIVGGAFADRLGLAHLGWAGLPFVAIGLVILAAGHTSTPAALLPREEPHR
jgi:DHA1 family inner membrane transport protein